MWDTNGSKMTCLPRHSCQHTFLLTWCAKKPIGKENAEGDYYNKLSVQEVLSKIQKRKGVRRPRVFQVPHDVFPILLNATKTLSTSVPSTSPPPPNFQHIINQSLKVAKSILEAMNHISIASSISQKLVSDSTSSNTFPLRENPTERMLQMMQTQCMMMPTEMNNPKQLTIETDSPSTMIGKVCLLPLLQLIHHLCKIGASQSLECNGGMICNTDEIIEIMQTLYHIALTCPTLLAGDVSVLQCFCQVLLSIASSISVVNLTTNAKHGFNPDVHKIQLASMSDSSEAIDLLNLQMFTLKCILRLLRWKQATLFSVTCSISY